MAKHLVRYLLNGNGTVPDFVESGGFFPVGEELVGISVDDEARYLPDSVVKLSREDLIARIESLGIPAEKFGAGGIPAVADVFIGKLA
jgi:hypothetical protein